MRKFNGDITVGSFKFVLVVDVDTGGNLVTPFQGNLFNDLSHFPVPKQNNFHFCNFVRMDSFRVWTHHRLGTITGVKHTTYERFSESWSKTDNERGTGLPAQHRALFDEGFHAYLKPGIDVEFL